MKYIKNYNNKIIIFDLKIDYSILLNTSNEIYNFF